MRRIHTEKHQTLNCEVCGANYCIDKDIDKEPCDYWCVNPLSEATYKGKCEFCKDKV